jgi:hypothetical protein
MDIWKAGPEVMKQVSVLIGKYHPHLALIEDEIGVIFREKASEIAGMVILGKTKKAPPLMSVLTDKKFNFRFLIELGADEWQQLTPPQQTALLDHHLCSMMAEEDTNSGEIKCYIRPPDFLAYKDEVLRHGMWRPMDDETLSAVEQMFGKKSKVAKPQKRAADPSDLDDVMDALDADSN